MSIHFPSATLAIGRDLIRDRSDTILSAIKTEDPAAWDHAMHLAQEIVAASRTGYVELRHYHESMASIASPELDAALEEFEELARQTAAIRERAEARQIDAANPITFNPIGETLAMVRPPHLAREA